jgi:hypothetical protein
MSIESQNPEQPELPDNRHAPARVANSIWSLMKTKAFWRFSIIISIISLLSMFLLGIAFFLIVTGALMIFMLISAVYQPAGRLVARIAGLPEGNFLFHQVTISFWKKLLITWPVVFYAYISGVGVWLLFKDGFLSQNLLYLIFIK